MARRHTNLALLWATILALASGVGAFTVGTTSGRWVVITHGMVALAIVVLIPWKSLIAARGMRKQRSGRAISIGVGVATLLTLASGVLLVTGATNSIGVFTTMQLHVVFGLLTVGLTLVHTLQRPVPYRATDLSRRNALRAGGVLAAAGGLWLVVEGLLDLFSAPGGNRRFTGSHEISDPVDVPHTQWLNDSVQHLDPKTHQISVADRTHSVAALAQTGDSILATLDCTGGWFTTQEWAGTRLDRLLASTDGTSIVVRSTTGYWRRFPREQASSLMLATHMAGQALPDGNGGPVRLVAPGRRGYWWVKWVSSIEIDDRPPWWQPPLPTA